MAEQDTPKTKSPSALGNATTSMVEKGVKPIADQAAKLVVKTAARAAGTTAGGPVGGFIADKLSQAGIWAAKQIAKQRKKVAAAAASLMMVPGMLVGGIAAAGAGALATLIAASVAAVLIVSFFLFVINSGAYIVPPSGNVDPCLTAVTPSSVGGTNSSLAEGKLFKIMPLGDSITAGFTSAGYRDSLYKQLKAANFTVDFVGTQKGPGEDPDHEGHGSFSPTDLAGGLPGWLGQSPDIVLLHAGTNKLYSEFDQNIKSIETMLQTINQRSPDTRILLALIIKRIDSDSTGKRTTEFNNKLKEIAPKYKNVSIVDMENALSYPTDIQGDGIHPRPSGYEKMATVWFNALKSNQTATSPSSSQNQSSAPCGLGQQSRYIQVTKAANPAGPFPNGANPKVTFTITVLAREKQLSNVRAENKCDVFTKTAAPQCNPPIPDANAIPGIIPAGESRTYSYTMDFPSPAYTDALVTDTFTVTADVEGAPNEKSSGSASIIIGNPPTECIEFAGSWNEGYKRNLIAAIAEMARAPRFFAQLCPKGPIFIHSAAQKTSNGRAYGGTALSWKDVEIYPAGASTLYNAARTLTHELGHILQYRTTIYRQWLDTRSIISSYTGLGCCGSVGVRTVTWTEGPFCTYPLGAHTPNEDFAEMVGLFISNQPRFRTRAVGGLNFLCMPGGYKAKYPSNWQFARDVVFGSDLDW